MSEQINVYVDGVFDLFHEGHVNFLRKAASFGTLIVGIHDDEFVMGYKRKPLIPEKSRYAVIESCKYVSQTICGVGILTEKMLDDYNIKLVVHGDDFSSEMIQKYYGAAVDRGIFQLVSYTRGISSTQIIENIKERVHNTILL